jgi:prolyl-tRNA synthetase
LTRILVRHFFTSSKPRCVHLPSIVSPLALNDQTFPKVQTIVDSSIANSSSTFALHALSSSSTLFLSGADILTYLRKLETEDTKIQELDFSTISAPAGAAVQTSKPPTKEKEDAKIEGAVQIAIGIKKEVDFAAWYTNVGPHNFSCVMGMITPDYRFFLKPI